ncbi:MAG: fimbrial protein, partial [Mixta calida]|nr:fimbrial protein [Mixta calida]
MAGLWSQAGQAENCGPATSQMTINLQNIKYLPTLPSDMQMTTPMADNGDGVHFTCDRQAPTATWKRIV